MTVHAANILHIHCFTVSH